VSPVAQYLVQSAVTLLGVLLLVGLIVMATRRLGVTAPDPSLELLARLPLEARRAVYVVRVKHRVFVVAANEHSITKLGEFAADEFPAGAQPLSGGFGDVLRRVLVKPRNLEPKDPT
jgi:flagellar biogenesis protein FliO